MGLFANGPNPAKVDIAGIAAVMREALYHWMNARIRIYDPQLLETTDYDPKTDQGGVSVPALLLDTGPGGAIVQPVRSATSSQFGSQSAGIQGIRFQIKRDSPTIVLRSGLIIEVVDGGEDSSLESFSFSLVEGTDSSFAWGRILEASVSYGGVASSVE